MAKISRENLSKIISPVFFLLLWYAVAFFMDAPLILPYPHDVIQKLFELAVKSFFWQNLAFTFLRVITAFIISFVAGFLAGFFSADFPVFKAFLKFPLAVIRVTPIIAFILLAIFWFNSDFVPVFVAILMALPVMISGCEKGFEKNPEKQEKLFKARCYGFTGYNAFRYIRLPDAIPSVMAGAESSFGLCWKVVAAGEVLSVPHYAFGTIMQKAQVHLETATVLAITLSLITVSALFQWLMKILILKFSSKKQEKAL